jgi:hypothetical protein
VRGMYVISFLFSTIEAAILDLNDDSLSIFLVDQSSEVLTTTLGKLEPSTVTHNTPAFVSLTQSFLLTDSLNVPG